MTTNNYVVAVHGGVARFHRATCRRVKKMAPAVLHDAATFVGELVPATCCKPNGDELRRQRGEAASAVADSERAAADARIAEVTAAVQAGEVVPALADLQQQVASAGPPPVAPVPSGRRERHPLYLQAIANKKAAAHVGRSAKGRKVTDEEMAQHMLVARAARPETTMSQEMEIAYWIDGLALTRTRWNTVWARTFGPSAAAPAAS